MDGIMQGRMDGGTGEKKDVECFNNTCCRKGYWGVECGNWSVRSARRAVYVGFLAVVVNVTPQWR